jgi:hypothetical protein
MTNRSRARISLTKKLAAALLTIRVEENGKLIPFIDHETAKKLTAAQIISLFEFDHWPIAVWLDGPDEPWNLVPRPIMEHRVKTASYDTPNSAKADRVTETQKEFQRKMLAKVGQGEPEPKAEKPKKKWKPDGAEFDWGKGRYVRQD